VAEQTLKQLSQRILKLSKRIEPNANEITKAAGKAFINEVVDGAPVDTGLTVSSWKVGLNYKPVGTRIFAPGVKGSTAQANRDAVKAAVFATIDKRVTGQTMSFTNSTPYLKYINGGDYQRYIDSALDRAKDAVRSRKILE